MGVTESGLVIRQSDLASFSYCAMRQKYDRTAAAAGRQPERLSATIAGTVAHYALEVMQRAVHEGREDALKVGLATFEHYWQPENTGQISEGPPTIWIARQTWGGVLAQMRSALAEAHEWMVKSKDILLATEYSFNLPIEVDGEIHTLHGTIDRLAIRMKDRMPVVSLDDWKGLALDTPIPTPDGWSTMGDLQVGDLVFAKDGTPCSVVGKSQVKNIGCFEVKFDDGTSVICDEEHLWEVTNGRGELEVLPVTKIRDTLFGPQGQRQYRIFNPAPLELPEADLPIDPYVYGVWLGDGRRNGSEVSKGIVDSDIFAEIERRGQPVSRHRQDPSRPNVAVWNLLGLTRKLRDAGLLGKVSVPDPFRRGSVQQRLDLLRGLMDSDGGWNKARRQAVFTSCDRHIAEAVHDLVHSLGERAVFHEIRGKGFGKDVTSYRVTWTPLSFNPFFTERKRVAAEDVPTSRLQGSRRLIVSVEEAPSVPTVCIRVDSSDHTFLCGKQMVVTHNTGVKPDHLQYAMQWTVYSWASTQIGFWNDFFDTPGFDEVDRRVSSRGVSLYESADQPLAERWGRWLAVRNGEFKVSDCGQRGEQHYARMRLAISQYVKAIRADVAPLTTDTKKCAYCAWRTICGDAPLPDFQEGTDDDHRY